MIETQKNFEFWLGRAGSGKTRACLEAIAAQMMESPRGKPLLLLVPEQASAQMEYALSARMGLTGFTRARVITFRYLKHEVFEAVGGKPRNIVDDDSRVILIRQIARRLSEELEVMGACADLPGLAESLSKSILEFQRYGWQAESLADRISQLADSPDDDVALRMKLSDLHKLWVAYEAELKSRGLADESAVLELAGEKLSQWDELAGARLWIDGFATFTVQEQRLLEGLLSQCESAAMCMCLDPHDRIFRGRVNRPGEWFVPRINERIGPERLFENVEQAYFSMRARLEEIRWNSNDIHFPLEDQPTRFAANPPLAHLEARALSRLQAVAYEGEDAAESIELLEADTRRAEVESIARKISALVRDEDHDFNWRDVAVLVRDTQPYSPLVREIFPRYGIPFFLDELREVSGHPLVRLLVSGLRLARYGWRTDYVLDGLKSGLTPLGESPLIGRLEHLALEERFNERDWLGQPRRAMGRSAGITARDPWATDESGELKRAWQTVADHLKVMGDGLRAGDDPALTLWNWLKNSGVAERLEGWIEAARGAGDEEAVLTHEQAWTQSLGMLDRVHTLGVHLEDATARLDELLEIFETGLTTLKVGLTPPTLDQVLVGAIDRTRTPPIRIAFVADLNEGTFPLIHHDDPVLSDRERQQLTDPHHPLGPDSQSKYSQERYLGYIALTRASEMLFVSRSVISGTERATGPSIFYRAIAEAFPRLEIQKVQAELELAEHEGEPVLPRAWAGALSSIFYSALEGQKLDQLAGVFARSHPLARPDLPVGAARESARRVFHALAPPPPAAVSKALAREFWDADRHLGVTLLQRFAQCPFQFYTVRMLRLRTRRDALPGPKELGSLRHMILEKLFAQLKPEGEGLDWGQIDLEDAKDRIEAIGWALANTELARDFGSDVLTGAMIEATIEEMKHFVVALREMGKVYALRQTASEYRFGRSGHPQFLLSAGDGFTFELEGSIDRIDSASNPGGGRRLVLYDYKSSAKNIDAALWALGANIQLAAYAVVLEAIAQSKEGPDVEVEGVFYWPLSIGLNSAEGEPESWAEPGSELWFAKHKPKGLFSGSIAPLLDTAAGSQEKALAFDFEYKKEVSGQPLEVSKRQHSWVEYGEFRGFIDQTQSLMQEVASNILSGEVPVQPLKKGTGFFACDLCDYEATCRIKFCETSPEQHVRTLKHADFKKRLADPDWSGDVG